MHDTNERGDPDRIIARSRFQTVLLRKAESLEPGPTRGSNNYGHGMVSVGVGVRQSRPQPNHEKISHWSGVNDREEGLTDLMVARCDLF